MGDLALAKSPTGIPGLDEVTEGGLPQGRPTLVCGTAGCGKTILGLQFLVRGALEFDEPGVFVSFEETAEELSQNASRRPRSRRPARTTSRACSSASAPRSTRSAPSAS
jgi:KaiC/GvpD/RAD55 family RecA-like ATPase